MNIRPGTIEHHICEMFNAVESQRYEDVYSEFEQALLGAQALVSERAPLLLLLICMAHNYETQWKFLEAENFNRLIRKIILSAKR